MRIQKILMKSITASILLALIVSVLVLQAYGDFLYDAPRGGTFRVCLKAEPPHLNGAFVYDVAIIDVAQNIYSTVVCQDYGIMEGQGPYGDLAERWAVSEDGLTYTFYLRKGIKWHDGVPFTSADVVYTWTEIIKNKYPQSSVFSDVQNITAPDNYTVVANFTQVNAAFIPMLATTSNWYGYILPKHLYEGTNWKNNTHNSAPVGTGPFKFENWVRGDYLSLVANEEFRGTRERNPNGPFVDRLLFKFIPDATVARAALEAGEVDYVDSYQAPPFGGLTSFAEKADINMVVGQSIYDRDLMFCWGKAPWNDSRVRLAVAYAIDREELCEVGYAGWYSPIYYVGCPGTPGWNNYDATFPHTNLTKAGELLDEAGYPVKQDGIRFSTTITDPAWTETGIAAEIIKTQLKKVGIDVKRNQYDYATWYSKVAVAFDYDLTIGYVRYGPDPDTYREHFGTKGVRNLMNYSNPQVDALLLQGVRTLDWDKRLSYYIEATTIIGEDMPYISLVGSPYFNFVREGWHGTHWESETHGHTFGWYGWCTVWYEAEASEVTVVEIAPWTLYVIGVLAAAIVAMAAAIVYIRVRRKKI